MTVSWYVFVTSFRTLDAQDKTRVSVEVEKVAQAWLKNDPNVLYFRFTRTETYFSRGVIHASSPSLEFNRHIVHEGSGHRVFFSGNLENPNLLGT